MLAAVIGGLLGGIELANRSVGSIGSARWPLFVIGLVLMAARVFVRQWAILTLGRFFTVDVRVHSDQTVVERGPYRWVRHMGQVLKLSSRGWPGSRGGRIASGC